VKRKPLRKPKKRLSKRIGTGVVATAEIMSRPKFLRNLKLGWHLFIDLNKPGWRQFFITGNFYF